MSGVLPVIISYPNCLLCPCGIKCINRAWCSSPKHHSCLGTFLDPILLRHFCFNSRMATSTCCNWLCLYGSAYVKLMPNRCTSCWNSVCWPTNATAMLHLRLAGILISFVKHCKDSVESRSPLDAEGCIAAKLPFEMTIAPVWPGIDLYLDSTWSSVHFPDKYVWCRWIWSARYRRVRGVTACWIPSCVVTLRIFFRGA